MDTLGDLVARDRTRALDGVALRTRGDRDREYDYRRFGATARRTGNYLRLLGVRPGVTVAVADDSAPEALFALLGTALLGGTASVRSSGAVDARAVVAPTGALDGFDLPPGGQRVGYGTPPADPAVGFFERDVWSENPGFPETAVDPVTDALRTDSGSYSHATLLDAAARVVAEWDVDESAAVAVRAPLAHPGTVVAGVLAPLSAGATVLLPETPDDDGVTGTLAVVGKRRAETGDRRTDEEGGDTADQRVEPLDGEAAIRVDELGI